MRKNLVLLLTIAMLLTTFVLPSHAQTPRKTEKAEPQETGNKASVSQDDDEDEDPDLPSIAGAVVNKQEFLLKRDEQINFLRGFPYPHPDSRVRAIYAMRRQEIALEQNRTQATEAASWRRMA